MTPQLTQPQGRRTTVAELVADRRATRFDRVAALHDAAVPGSARRRRLRVILYCLAYGGSIRAASRALKRL